MADVTLGQTHPGVIREGGIPKGQEPVRTDRERFFPRTGEPVANSQATTIFRREDIPSVEARPITTNVEATMTPTGQPVTNDVLAAILGTGPTEPPAAPIPNADVRLAPAPQPISNDGFAGKIHFNAPPSLEPRPFIEGPPAIPPGTPVSNESSVSFTPSPLGVAHYGGGHAVVHSAYAPENRPEPIVFQQPEHRPHQATVSNEEQRFIRQAPVPLNFGGDVFIAPSAGSIQGGMQDAQILGAIGTPMTADTDRTIGGGGEQAKAPRADEVSFAGQGKLNVGGTEVMSALTGDNTKIAGSEDVSMTPNAGSLGNHESYAGAQGDPTNNKDYNDFVPGAVGKPLKKNVT